MDLKQDFASNSGRKPQISVRKCQTNAECAACSVEHMVNYRHGGGMDSTDRLFRLNFRLTTDANLSVVRGRHEYFDPERVDLCQREHWALLISILAWHKKPLDHHAIDRAS